MATFRKWIRVRKWCRENTRRLVLLLILVILSFLLITWRFLILDCKSIQKHKPVACLRYRGRLGNQMFMYAFHYIFVKEKELKMVKTGSFDLNDIFVLEDDSFGSDKAFNPSFCNCFPTLAGIHDCGFDDELNLWPDGKGVFLDGYFQSWRYFTKNATSIRKLFTFREEIRTKVEEKLQKILQTTNWNYRTDKIVGMHVRRGDFTNKRAIDFGKKLPPVKYFLKSMRHMISLFQRVKFLVFSNDIYWSRERFERFSNVFFAEGNTPAEDMAMLSLLNHTIISVGTFGWWAAFLTNGTTIYFKDVFIPNSEFAAEFRNNSIEDFFPPSWIGID